MNGEVGNGDGTRPCPMVEQTVGWALHALEPDEEAAVLEHLPGCAECRGVAADVAGVTVDLATALPQEDPPPRLRESIVEQARRTPQAGRDERPAPGQVRRSADQGRGRPVAPAADRSPVSVPPPDAGRRSGPAHSSRPAQGDAGRIAGERRPPAGPGRTGERRRQRRLLVAAVAVVAVLAGGGVVAGEIQSLRAERDASLAQAQQMEGVLSALARPGTQHAFLAPQPDAPAVAVVLVSDGQREIVPMGLEPNHTAEQTYDVVDTPQPMVDAVASIIAWKFALYGVDPRGSTTLVSGGTEAVESGATFTRADAGAGSYLLPGSYFTFDQARAPASAGTRAPPREWPRP